MQSVRATEQPRYPSPAAAFLSYLVPGLGQLYQGRVAKGVLFLVCIYGLFFTGMALGQWKNVYLPPDTDLGGAPWMVPRRLVTLYNRIHFAGQVWVGAAAWPALWQYASYEPNDPSPPLGGFMRMPSEADLNELQIKGDKTWDLGWVYTVIAGVLNILVIYDAFAGPAFGHSDEELGTT